MHHHHLKNNISLTKHETIFVNSTNFIQCDTMDVWYRLTLGHEMVKRGWVKCNPVGVTKGASSSVVCEGIFRDYRVSFMGGFSFNLGNSFALHVELVGIMVAIETTFDTRRKKCFDRM